MGRSSILCCKSSPLVWAAVIDTQGPKSAGARQAPQGPRNWGLRQWLCSLQMQHSCVPYALQHATMQTPAALRARGLACYTVLHTRRRTEFEQLIASAWRSTFSMWCAVDQLRAPSENQSRHFLAADGNQSIPQLPWSRVPKPYVQYMTQSGRQPLRAAPGAGRPEYKQSDCTLWNAMSSRS